MNGAATVVEDPERGEVIGHATERPGQRRVEREPIHQLVYPDAIGFQLSPYRGSITS